MTNLLMHGDFDGQYEQYQDYDNMLVAVGWRPFWRQRTAQDPEWKWRKPEMNPAAPYQNRIHSGLNAQHWFTFQGTHSAGILQRVAVPVGVKVRFGAWSQVWSTEGDNADESGSPENGKDNGHLETRIGIDFDGNENPWSTEVVWSDWLKCYDDYKQATLEGMTQSGYVTVFLRSECMYPVKHNDVYFDDAVLEIVGDEPSPQPGGIGDELRNIAAAVMRIADKWDGIIANDPQVTL